MRVIETRSFRWSSPTKFNDPFDHQTGFTFQIDEEEFANLLTSSVERIIFSDNAIPVAPTTTLAQLAIHLRLVRHRLNRKEIINELRKGCRESAQGLSKGIGRLNETIQEHLCHSRVFCVSEKHDNVVMWSHYSEEHRGVVFQLRCLDKVDNTLLQARRVNYTDSFIAFPTTNEYARHLTGENPIDMVPLCWKIPFTKHIDWSYEKEWRVHIPLLDQPKGDGHTIYEEDPCVFGAVYLGCRMEEEKLTKIIPHIRRFLPDTKIYRAEKSKTAFALTFIEQTGI